MKPVIDPHSKFIASGLAVFSAMALTAFSQQLPDPLLYYSFDVEDGVNVENAGTLQTAGMISGGVTYGESKEPSFGTAFYGNRTGANDAYIQTGFTGTVLGLGPDSVYTAMAWVNWDGASGNVDHMVFGQEDGPGNAAMLHHGIRADSESNAHYGGWGNDLGDAGVVPVGEWTHLAFQFDGADKVVFVNGVETARGGGSPMSGHAFPVIIGGHGRDAADPAGQSFNGAIDEVKIYDEVLTAQQILEALDPAPDTGEDNENGGAGDGMDDGWEAANGLDPAVDDSAGNPDNDGLTNLEEWNGGDNPTDPIDADSDNDDLTDGDEVNTHGTDPNDADSDNDGLNDGVEIAASTLPLDPDTDGDEMGDGYEVDSGHNPLLAADAAEDADNDGSSNLEECQRGTDPNEQDTDMDGFLDGVEDDGGAFVSATMTGTDPLNSDTDGDGLLDGVEDNGGTFVDATQTGSDPNKEDTDGDGFADLLEIDNGSDPNDIDSSPGSDELTLLAYFNFDGQLADQEGNTPDAVLNGAAVLTTTGMGSTGSPGDEALDLGADGDGSFAQTPAGTHLDQAFINNSMSVAFWQFNTGFGNSSAFWLTSPEADGGQRGFQAHTPWGNGTIYFDQSGCCDGPERLTVAGAAIENEWQHFVFQRDEFGERQIWIDGLLTANAGGADPLDPFDGIITIGGNQGGGNSFGGRIDDFAIFANTLSPEQIMELASGANPPDLVGPPVPFIITEINHNAATGATMITWNSRTNKTYAVDISDDLITWDELDDGVASEGESTSYSDNSPAGTSHKFYRAREIE